MTSDPYVPPPPYSPSDPLTPTSPQAPEFSPHLRGGDGAIPPYSPTTRGSRSLRRSRTGDQTAALPHFSSAAGYFEGRQVPDATRSNVVRHQLFISPNDRAEDHSGIPLCWRGRDLTQPDMDTFSNFLLPPNTTKQLPRKLRMDLSKDEKEPMSPTDIESEAERKDRISLVAAEWNEGFFYPRGLQVEISFVGDRPPHAARGLSPMCESCVAVNNSSSRYIANTYPQQPQPLASWPYPVTVPSQPPIPPISIPPVPQPSQPPAGLGPLSYLRAGVERLTGAYGRGGPAQRQGEDFRGNRYRNNRQRHHPGRSASSSSSDDHRHQRNGGRGWKHGRGRRSGGRHHHGRSSSTSSSSSDSDHDRRGGHGRGRGRGRNAGFGDPLSHHNHKGRRGRSTSTSSSSSSSSESSMDSISSRETRGLGLEDLRRSIAAVKLEKEGQKFEAKTAVKELKQNLKGMKKEMHRTGRDARSICKEEKKAIKQELRSVKKEFKDNFKEMVREKRGLKQEKKGLKREEKDMRRSCKRDDRDRRREMDRGKDTYGHNYVYPQERGEMAGDSRDLRYKVAGPSVPEGQISGVMDVQQPAKDGYPRDVKA